jgi:hypothetical protein
MSDTDLFREVEEDLQRERMERLWKKYGKYVLATVAAILLGFGGYQVWKQQTEAAAADRGARFVAAVDYARDGKTAESEVLFKALAAEAPGAYAVLAKMRLADAATKAGKPDDAFATYEALGKDASIDPTMRQFAQLQAAALQVDKADLNEMQARLTPLAENSSPWRHSARELLGLSAYRAGKFDDAESQFQLMLGDRATPNGLSQRAQMMLDVILAATIKAPIPDATKPAGDAKPANAATDGKKPTN